MNKTIITLSIFTFFLFAFGSSALAKTNAANGARIFTDQAEVQAQDESSCYGFVKVDSKSQSCRPVKWDGGFFGFAARCKVDINPVADSNCQTSQSALYGPGLPFLPYTNADNERFIRAHAPENTNDLLNRAIPNLAKDYCSGYIRFIQGNADQCKAISWNSGIPPFGWGAKCVVSNDNSPIEKCTESSKPAQAGGFESAKAIAQLVQDSCEKYQLEDLPLGGSGCYEHQDRLLLGCSYFLSDKVDDRLCNQAPAQAPSGAFEGGKAGVETAQPGQVSCKWNAGKNDVRTFDNGASFSIDSLFYVQNAIPNTEYTYRGISTYTDGSTETAERVSSGRPIAHTSRADGIILNATGDYGYTVKSNNPNHKVTSSVEGILYLNGTQVCTATLDVAKIATELEAAPEPEAGKPEPASEPPAGVAPACGPIPQHELYDCSKGQACYNDYKIDTKTCTREPNTAHCDTDANASVYVGNTNIGTVGEKCADKGLGWSATAFSSCGSRTSPGNRLQRQHDCSQNLRCFDLFYRDEGTQCQWADDLITTPDPAKGGSAYVGGSSFCIPDPGCDGAREPYVVRPGKYMDEYLEAIKKLCEVKYDENKPGFFVPECLDAVQTNCLSETDPSKNKNKDPEKREELRQCEELNIEKGKALAAKKVANDTASVNFKNLPAAGGKAKSKSDLQINMVSHDAGADNLRVYAPGSTVDIGARLYNNSLGKDQIGCVNLDKQNQISFKIDGEEIALVPPCHPIQDYPLPTKEGQHYLTASFPGDDNIGPSGEVRIDFEIGSLTAKRADQNENLVSIKAQINGSTSLEAYEGDDIWVGGRAFVQGSEDNCSLQQPLDINIFKQDDLENYTLVYERKGAQNCQSYPDRPTNKELPSELALHLNKGTYYLVVELPGITSFKPSLRALGEGVGQAKLIVHEKAAQEALKIGFGGASVAGIAVENKGDKVIVTNDPNSNAESVVLTPCATTLDGSPADIAAIHLFARRVNDDGKSVPPLIDDEVANCYPISIPIDNLTDLDRVDVIASYDPPAGSPYAAASADLVIDEDDTQAPVAAEPFVELDSFPDQVSDADTEAQITASTNQPVEDPTFKITDDEGNITEVPADVLDEDCSPETGICTYSTDLYNPSNDQEVEFCVNETCDDINLDETEAQQEETPAEEPADSVEKIEIETESGRVDVTNEDSFVAGGNYAAVFITYTSGKQRLLTYYFEKSQAFEQPAEEQPAEEIEETQEEPTVEESTCPENCNLIDGACWEGPYPWEEDDSCREGFDSYDDGCWRRCE